MASSFSIFGLNGFLHFIPVLLRLPERRASSWGRSLFPTYLVVDISAPVISAVLLLLNRYVPLALTLLAPIIVNILLFHLLMAPSGLPLAVVVTVLWDRRVSERPLRFRWALAATRSGCRTCDKQYNGETYA